MIALDYRRDPSTTWEHVGDVHADDLRDHLSSWMGPSLTTGDLVRAVGDGHESLHVWSGSELHDVRDEQGPLTASQWEGDDADAVEMLRRCTHVDRRLVVLAACDCAETALQYVPAGEERPRIAIETARRWARGEETTEDVRRAADAAWDAAWDAIATAYAARAAAAAAATATDAARAADYASSATDAARASSSATDAARASAYAYADDATDAWRSARASSLRSMASLVRRHIPLSVLACSLVGAADPLPLHVET